MLLSSGFKRWFGKHDADGLLRHSAIVIFFTNLGSVTNLLFHMIMGRQLGAGEYAILTSMLGLYLIFTTPIMALQNTLAHFSGDLFAQGREGDIRRLVAFWCRRVLYFLVPVLCIGIVFSPYIAGTLLHLPSRTPVIVVTLMIVLNYYLAVYVGLLQGVQYFVWMCLAANTWAIVRIMLGYGLVILAGAWALWGLVGHLAGLLISLLIGMLIFGNKISRQTTSLPLERSDGYMIRSMISLLSFSVLMTGDIVLVKILFPAEADHGPYARASTIARTLIFLCQPIAGALFPKVISKGGRSPAHNSTLWKAVGLSALIVAGAVVLCVSMPRLPLWVLYDKWDADDALIRLVRLVAMAMSPLGLVFLLINFEMAQHRFRFMVPLALCATGFVLGAVFFHATLARFVVIYSAATCSATVIMLVDLFRQPPRDQGLAGLASARDGG